MNTFFESIANHSMTNQIGMVLVHFLWQATLVAIACWAILKLQKRCSSQTRYVTSLTGLLVMVACPLMTFVVLDRGLEPGEASVAHLRAPESQPSVSLNDEFPAITIEGVTANSDNRGDGSSFEYPALRQSALPNEPSLLVSPGLKATLPWLVAMWCAGVLILAIRLMSGLNRIRMWRRSATEMATPELAMMGDQLCDRMGLKRGVRFLESVYAGSPVVISWIRPAVLIPSSFILGLTPREMEAILVHELAHIRRHDYLINLAQAIVETVLFYHPAVWWLSNRVRVERENCCDDVAIEVCNDRKVLVHALAKLEEIRCRDFQVAVAADGGSVIDRIRRILDRQPQHRQSAWPAGIVAFLSVICLVALLLASSGSAELFADSSRSEADSTEDVGGMTTNTERGHNAGPGQNTEPGVIVLSEEDDDYETQKGEIKKQDSKTGIEQSLVAGVVLSGNASGETQVAVDMKFTNLLPYSLIPARLANELGAVELGQIDFSDSDPEQQVPDEIWNALKVESKRQPEQVEESNTADRSNTKFVNEVSEADPDVTIVPYPTDAVWFPGHLGFYGMNQIKQRVFKVVRIEKVDLGIGPAFGPINALVLDDQNSDFGLLGRDWFQGPQGKNGERLVFLAAGPLFKFLPPPEQPAANATDDDQTGQQREDRAGVTVLGSHTYDQKQRTSKAWVDMEEGRPIPLGEGVAHQRVAVDDGIAHEDRIIYLTLMGDVVAADAESGKGKWLIPWRKMTPWWKTVSIVTLDRNGSSQTAVELFAPKSGTFEPAYRYHDFESGELIDFATPDQQVREWGPAPEQGNLRLRLNLNESELEEGQPVLASLEIMNVGDRVESYDPQYYSGFRVLKANHVSGDPDQYIGGSYQTMGGPKPLQPGESQLIWENVDVGTLYMLEQGEYQIQAVMTSRLPESTQKSNVIALQISPGQPTPHKKLMKSLTLVAPDEWTVSGNARGVYLSHSPTGLKRDIATISLSFSPEALPADRQPTAYLGETELGHLNLNSDSNAVELWPDHVEKIREASSSIR